MVNRKGQEHQEYFASEINLYPTQPRTQPRQNNSRNPQSDARVLQGHHDIVKELEEQHRQSYSHGLEDIYALENVDLSTVRRLDISQHEEVLTPSAVIDQSEEFSEQLEMDLGREWRGWMDSLILKEPIKVLGLPAQLENSLSERGIGSLKDLWEPSEEEMVSLGFGQGHIDEFSRHLERYLQGRPLQHCQTVDFASLLRSLVADENEKKMHLCVENYGLARLFPLSRTQTMELRRLDVEQRRRLHNETLRGLTSTSKYRNLDEILQEVVTVFVIPWIHQRGGLTNSSEVKERLWRISIDPSIAQKVIHFLSDVYYDGGCPVTHYLLQLEEDVFSSDKTLAHLYREVMEKVNTYFYQAGIVYSLSQLVRLVEGEFSLKWKSLPEGFVERALRLSVQYRIRKGADGLLYVRKSQYCVGSSMPVAAKPS